MCMHLFNNVCLRLGIFYHSVGYTNFYVLKKLDCHGMLELRKLTGTFAVQFKTISCKTRKYFIVVMYCADYDTRRTKVK